MAKQQATGATTGGQPDREQLHRIVEGLSDGVVLIEPDGRITRANGAALAMHGCSALADLGNTANEYAKRFDLRLRDGQPLPATAYPMARLCRGEAFEDVVLDVRKAGQPDPDWVHRERGFVLDRDSEPDCLVLILCDATESTVKATGQHLSYLVRRVDRRLSFVFCSQLDPEMSWSGPLTCSN